MGFVDVKARPFFNSLPSKYSLPTTVVSYVEDPFDKNEAGRNYNRGNLIHPKLNFTHSIFIGKR